MNSIAVYRQQQAERRTVATKRAGQILYCLALAAAALAFAALSISCTFAEQIQGAKSTYTEFGRTAIELRRAGKIDDARYAEVDKAMKAADAGIRVLIAAFIANENQLSLAGKLKAVNDLLDAVARNLWSVDPGSSPAFPRPPPGPVTSRPIR